MNTEEVADALLALDEPWRSRFLKLTANIATGWSWNGRGEPTREELEEWLENPGLRRRVTELLQTWTGGRLP